MQSRKGQKMGGIGHVDGCREAPCDTRVSGSDGARALQVGGIGHVGGCCEAPYDTRESGSDIARALQGCRALVPLLRSGTESDPHVSKPSFRVESDKVCL
jgi:hypothetical protein